MKKILALIVLAVAMVSCYDEYILDYTYSAIYFSYQQDVRTFVVGEGMKIEVGADLGGVRKNDRDRNVSFILDNTLITPALLTSMQTASQPYIKSAVEGLSSLSPLPANYYTISNSSTMVIKKGEHCGTVVIKPDSALFLNDSAKTIMANYILPFYITDADADSILEPRRSNKVGVKFENMLFGNYWHGGSAVVNRPAKTDTTISYRLTVPAASESKVWNLTTIGPRTLTANGYYSKDVTADPQLKLVLKGTNVYLSSAAGSAYTFTADGPCTYNNPKLLQDRKLFLKYKYTDPVSGYTYHCTDTLAFRNRLRDGINEWYDEKPSHYSK